MSAQATSFWVVIPAAGSARRMGGAIPKQYLPLARSTVIEHSIAPFLTRPNCSGVVVVLAAGDQRWGQLAVSKHPKILVTTGGAERADSVRAGLDALAPRAAASDWVLVHDAARPCLTSTDLSALLEQLLDDEVGGLLAAPLVDTLKRADERGRVRATVDRAGLWRALTPQMFRLDVLRRALDAARERGSSGTDDAQAVEALGLEPKLVAGSGDNIKITLADDLERAERILAGRTHSERGST